MTLYCDGCGRRWYPKRDGVWPESNHGHTDWVLLVIPFVVLLAFLVILVSR
jgi:hypothetical protein